MLALQTANRRGAIQDAQKQLCAADLWTAHRHRPAIPSTGLAGQPGNGQKTVVADPADPQEMQVYPRDCFKRLMRQNSSQRRSRPTAMRLRLKPYERA